MGLIWGISLIMNFLVQSSESELECLPGCWLAIWEFPGEEGGMSETGSSIWRAGKDQRKTDHSRWVDGSFNKQGNLHTRFVLVAARPVNLHIYLL